MNSAIDNVDFKHSHGNLYSLKADGNIHSLNFLDTKSIQIGVNKSSANAEEFRFIAGMAFTLSHDKMTDMSGNMTLTAYNEQHSLLESLKPEYPGLRTRKIDLSQGGEVEMVVFSIVRTLGTGIVFLDMLAVRCWDQSCQAPHVHCGRFPTHHQFGNVKEMVEWHQAR